MENKETPLIRDEKEIVNEIVVNDIELEIVKRKDSKGNLVEILIERIVLKNKDEKGFSPTYKPKIYERKEEIDKITGFKLVEPVIRLPTQKELPPGLQELRQKIEKKGEVKIQYTVNPLRKKDRDGNALVYHSLNGKQFREITMD